MGKKGIVKSHGGFIEVESIVSQGTQIQVFLPSVEPSTTALLETQQLLQSQGELVLIVDDEAPIRQTTQTSLELYGYQVMIVSDGIEAIAVYAEHKHDSSVVLMDMIMPSMDGATAIRTLRKIKTIDCPH